MMTENRRIKDIDDMFATRALAAHLRRPLATKRSSRSSSSCTARSSTVVRDFLQDEAFAGQDKGYLKARPLDYRRHGKEAAAHALRGIPVRDHHAALRDPLDDHDQQPPAGELGRTRR